MAKFKVGDKVRVNNTKDYWWPNWIKELDDGLVYTITDIGRSERGEGITLKEDIRHIFNEKNFELYEESTMKSTINLEELLEKNACEEGIKWFTRNFSVKNNEEVKDVVNHPECKDSYKTWLRDNGYSVDDEKEKFYEEFFQQIKGKKIRWSGWNKGDWAIFDRREEDKIFLKEKNFASYIDDYYYIENGFNKNQSNNNWELYQEEEKEGLFWCFDNGDNVKRLCKGKESDIKKEWRFVVRATKSDFEGLL